METANATFIIIETIVNAPIEKVWESFTEPQHIMQWCQASDDWHAPYAENDVRTNGKFKTTMAAKDGSFSFDFEGQYTAVDMHKQIEYAMADGRKVKVEFMPGAEGVKVTETFEAEKENTPEQQQQGWQAILNSFKKYTEQIS